MASNGTLILSRQDIEALLDLGECIEAVEDGFRRQALGDVIAPGVLGTEIPGGGFHVKTAGYPSTGTGRALFVTKVNANFPGNPGRFGLPTIQGVLALFDADDGQVLALMDSIAITRIRTAAATAVAARHCAAPDAGVITICGCGDQAATQLEALGRVRPVRRVMAVDLLPERAAAFANRMRPLLGIDVQPVDSLGDATRESAIWVTCTTSRRWILGRDHVSAGAFVAAVGADNPHKQEIEPELLAASAVITDLTNQCATIGDLRHAISSGLMQPEDVRAELGQVIAGLKPGRQSPDEVVVFDSTGMGVQDVAAAALVHARALACDAGIRVDLGGLGGVGCQ